MLSHRHSRGHAAFGSSAVSPRLLAAICGAAVSGSALAYPGQIVKVALTGEIASEATVPFGVGVDGRGFSLAVINASGQVSYAARLTGAGVVTGLNDRGVYRNLGGGNQQVARSGLSAPGTPGTFQFIGEPLSVIAGDGTVACNAPITGGGVTNVDDTTVHARGAGALGLVARENSAAPGIASVNYGASNPGNAAFLPVLANAGGKVSYISGLRGASVLDTTDSAVWAGTPGSPTLVAREGAATVTIANVNYGQMLAHSFNNTDRVAVRSQLAGSGVTDQTNEAIFSLGSGGNFLIAREGAFAPGGTYQFTAGGLINKMGGTPGLNDAGKVAFRSALANGGVTTANDSGVFAGTPGVANFLQLVQRENNAAPGLTNIQFDSFDDPAASDPVVAGNGSVGMLVKLKGTGVTTTNDSAIYFGPTMNNLVAREGAQVAGWDAGVTFASFNDGAATAPSVNAAGDVAFKATVAGTGVTLLNNTALFGWDALGGLCKIMRTGDQIDVSGMGDLRTVSDLDLVVGSGGQDGHASGLNDLRQVVFSAKFTDGSSGVFLTTIPAPTGGAVALVGLGLLGTRRRRRAM